MHRSIVIKPGTHSKHLRVENGSLVELRTFITGELFDVLAKHSILAHSVGDPTGADLRSPESLAELRAGVRHGRSIPLSQALFRVRTRQLLDNLSVGRNLAYMSGVLLGGELTYLSGASFDRIVLCAKAPVEAHYSAAFEELGLAERLTVVPSHEVELLSARGQAAVWRSFSGD